MYDADGGLKRSVSRVRDFAAAHEFPNHDAVRVHITFFIVKLVGDDFRSHPAIRSSLSSHRHSVTRLDAGDTKDAAVKAWVYYRAFTTLANWIAGKPNLHSYTGDDRREAWGNDRVKHWQTKAEGYLAQFNTLAEPVITYSSIGYSVSAQRLAVW